MAGFGVGAVEFIDPHPVTPRASKAAASEAAKVRMMFLFGPTWAFSDEVVNPYQSVTSL
jgi:hypothetical protein